MIKNPSTNAGDVRDSDSIPRSERSPEEGNPTPVFLPGESPQTAEPGSYSPRGRKVSDTTEVT